jgi:hypothetical protein
VIGLPVYKETTDAGSLAGGIGDGPGTGKLTTKEAVVDIEPKTPGTAA